MSLLRLEVELKEKAAYQQPETNAKGNLVIRSRLQLAAMATATATVPFPDGMEWTGLDWTGVTRLKKLRVLST